MKEELSLKSEEVESVRLDAFLSKSRVVLAKAPELSRAQIKKLIEQGAVLINGKPALKAGAEVKPGAVVKIKLDLRSGPDHRGEDIPIEVLYEDEHLIIVNKPPNLVVHPGAGNKTGTLVNALIGRGAKLSARAGDRGRPGIVHRLDKDTSGVVAVAKTAQAHKALVEQFQKRTVGRAYYALVFSTPRASRNISRDDFGVIDAPIGRHPSKRTIMAVLKDGGRRAVTHWRVVERMPYGTLLELRLETGRTHQIRVHMQHIGSPVIGDRVYGEFSGLPAKLLRAAEDFGRQALHAYRLEFIHPVSGKKLSFVGGMPQDFKSLLAEFGASAKLKC